MRVSSPNPAPTISARNNEKKPPQRDNAVQLRLSGIFILWL